MTKFVLERTCYINNVLASPGEYMLPKSQALMLHSFGYGKIETSEEANDA